MNQSLCVRCYDSDHVSVEFSCPQELYKTAEELEVKKADKHMVESEIVSVGTVITESNSKSRAALINPATHF